MGAARESIQEVLAANVRMLMDRRGWNQEQLAKRAHMSQTHVGNVLRKNAAPTSTVIEKLATAFGIESYLLVIPNLTVELLDSNEIPALLKTWLAARQSR